MDFSALSEVLSFSHLLLLLLLFTQYFEYLRAARNTHVRYWAATWCLTLSGLIIAINAIGLVFGMVFHPSTAWTWVVNMLVGAYYLYLVTKSGDDNWFNDQWKKLKRGIKQLKSRLKKLGQSLQPRPGFAPA